MAQDDLKSHALDASEDFYELLGVAESAAESEIRRAYRKTALKYHPDKVGASNQAALEKFHTLQIAYDVLSDPAVKELYDNARRARAEKKAREVAYEGRRKWMKEDLERRESGGFKRKRDMANEEEAFERELKRLAEDGRRRRREREDELRREVMVHDAEVEEEQKESEAVVKDEVADIDRSITFRVPRNSRTEKLTKEALRTMFGRFGAIEEIVLKERKVKAEGQKHRQLYFTAIVVFESIVSAYSAVVDFPKVQKEDDDFAEIEQLGWAAGKEPDCIPRMPGQTANPEPSTPQVPQKKGTGLDRSTPATPATKQDEGLGLKKVPSFASFKSAGINTPTKPGTPSSDDIMMIRLKNAERRRLEEKIRREETRSDAAHAES